jgi:hypothetical protein
MLMGDFFLFGRVCVFIPFFSEKRKLYQIKSTLTIEVNDQNFGKKLFKIINR